MTFVCGATAAPGAALRVLSGLASCCAGAVTDGPLGCTCWTIEYDRPQLESPPSTGGRLLAEVETRDAMCDDCAFRPDSPERTGHEGVANASLGELLALPNFYCHQGARRAVRYRHRLGLVVEAGDDGADYQPLIMEGEVDGTRQEVPLKADGTPLDRCAGWAAHHRPVDGGEFFDVEWDRVNRYRTEATLWGGLWAATQRVVRGEWRWKVIRWEGDHNDVVAEGVEREQPEAQRAAVRWAWEHRTEYQAAQFGGLLEELKGEDR